MGSCCVAENDLKNEQVVEMCHSDTQATAAAYDSNLQQALRTNNSFVKCINSEFYRKLEKGIGVMVIPVARTGIMCQIRYDAKFKRLILSKDTNSRQVQLSSLQRVMHTKKDLERVENQATMAEDENCCALLLKTHSCIGLRFATKAENQAFIKVVEELIAHYKATASLSQ